VNPVIHVQADCGQNQHAPSKRRQRAAPGMGGGARCLSTSVYCVCAGVDLWRCPRIGSKTQCTSVVFAGMESVRALNHGDLAGVLVFLELVTQKVVGSNHQPQALQSQSLEAACGTCKPVAPRCRFFLMPPRLRRRKHHLHRCSPHSSASRPLACRCSS